MLSNLQPTTILSQTPYHLTMLTEILLSPSRNIPPKAYHSFKRPGWSPALKAASRRCKQFYRVWVKAGNPRNSNHPARASYIQSKREYRAQLRLNKKLADENLFNSMDLEMDPHSFLQTMRRHTFASRPVTNYISVGGNNFEGPEILEDGNSTLNPLVHQNNISGGLNCQAEIFGNYPVTEPELITTGEIKVLISALPLRKAADHDNLTSEHHSLLLPFSPTFSRVSLTQFSSQATFLLHSVRGLSSLSQRIESLTPLIPPTIEASPCSLSLQAI